MAKPKCVIFFFKKKEINNHLSQFIRTITNDVSGLHSKFMLRFGSSVHPNTSEDVEPNLAELFWCSVPTHFPIPSGSVSVLFFSRPYFVRVAVPGQPFPFRPSSVRCRGRLYTCYTLTRFLRDIRLRTVIDWTQLERYIMAWPICGFPWKIYMYSFCLLRVLLAKRFFVIHI